MRSENRGFCIGPEKTKKFLPPRNYESQASRWSVIVSWRDEKLDESFDWLRINIEEPMGSC